MSKSGTRYVEQTPQGAWRIAGTRVSLDSVVHAYWEGLSPETIVDEFSSLTAEQVLGALAFYQRNHEVIDGYLHEQAVQWEQLRQESEEANRDLLERLRAHRSL